jgi:hypothetical protein
MVAYILVFLVGCNISHERVSHDVDLLSNLVETDLSISAAHWEIFNTPEYIGGVPGAADYTTLIVEIEPVDLERFQARPKEGTVWVAPEAVRSWLTESSRLVLRKYRNRNMNLSNMPNCRKLHAKLRKTGKPIEGFICNGLGKSLVYLKLSDNTVS